MLSFAVRRLAHGNKISATCCPLQRKGGSRHERILRLKSSTAATAEAAAVPRQHLVVSRRKWKSYEKTLPAKPRPNLENPDDKPWPRNVRIGGYVAASIFIPYATVWLITSNPTLREWFGPILPLEKLRKHFGEEEWDAQSEVDAIETLKAKQEVPDGYYHFPLEPGYKDRRQQIWIEELDATQMVVNLYYYIVGSSDNQESSLQTTATKEVRASTKANIHNLAELMGQEEKLNTMIAIDFENNDDESQKTSDPNSFSSTTATTFGGDDGTLYSDPSENVASSSSTSGDIHPLLKTIYCFSSWAYIPGSGQGNQEQTTQSEMIPTAMNSRDLEISRLEYVIDNLEKDLKDPMCTKDIDDMTTELNQSKSQLRKLKWKRRLGW